MTRGLTRLTSAVAAAVFVLVSAPAAGADGDLDNDSLVYVALGDSYASYCGVLPQIDVNCTRSSRNYASLVAAAIGADVFRDVTCGGASTNEMFNGVERHPRPATRAPAARRRHA